MPTNDRVERDTRRLLEPMQHNQFATDLALTAREVLAVNLCATYECANDFEGAEVLLNALAAAGLTLAPIEPYEARLLKVAKAIDPVAFEDWNINQTYSGAGMYHEEQRLRQEKAIAAARAAWRAGVDPAS